MAYSVSMENHKERLDGFGSGQGLWVGSFEDNYETFSSVT
jgi:hypothetical protein